MIERITSFWTEYGELIDFFVEIIQFAVCVINFVFCYLIYRFYKKIGYKKIELSCGSFKVSRNYFDVQNITNLVSLHFYDGGLVPPEVRKEILEKTSPKIKDKKTASITLKKTIRT